MICRLSTLFAAAAAAAVIKRPAVYGNTTAQSGANGVSPLAAISSALPVPTAVSKWIVTSTSLGIFQAPRIQLVESAVTCTPKMICMDKITPCGQRYGGSVLCVLQAVGYDDDANGVVAAMIKTLVMETPHLIRYRHVTQPEPMD